MFLDVGDYNKYWGTDLKKLDGVIKKFQYSVHDRQAD